MKSSCSRCAGAQTQLKLIKPFLLRSAGGQGDPPLAMIATTLKELKDSLAAKGSSLEMGTPGQLGRRHFKRKICSSFLPPFPWELGSKRDVVHTEELSDKKAS